MIRVLFRCTQTSMRRGFRGSVQQAKSVPRVGDLLFMAGASMTCLLGVAGLTVALRGAKNATDEDEALGPAAELIQEMR
jgi:hypothetical protein